MKLSDGFDARRLRPRQPGNWRLRLAALLAALFAAGGVLLAMAGAASLLGRAPDLGALNDSRGAAGVLLAAGLLLLWGAILVWRHCRRRPSGLSLAPHLMKKRN